MAESPLGYGLVFIEIGNTTFRQRHKLKKINISHLLQEKQ